MSDYTIALPGDPIALVIWAFLFGLLIFFIFRMREKNVKINRSTLIWMAILSILILGLTPFFGIPVELDAGSHFNQSPALHLMFFAAVPWMVAGGIIGVIPASLLAGMSGLLFSYLETHQIYTPLVFISMALFFTWGVRQRYRTTFYKFLRIPIFSSLFTLIISTPLLFLTHFLTLSGEFPTRIAITLSRMPEILITYGGMLMIGGFICILVAAIFPNKWGSSTPLSPAPGELSIKNRILLRSGPILLVLLTFIFGFIWRMNVNVARRDLVNELVNTSKIASEGWSVFTNAGLMALRDVDEGLGNTEENDNIPALTLAQIFTEISFFRQLTVFSLNGEIIATHAQPGESDPIIVPEEILGISRRLEKGDVRIISTSTGSDDWGNDIDFFWALPGEPGQGRRVVWGSTTIIGNPFSGALESALEILEDNYGCACIIDSTGQVLFSSEANGLSTDFTGRIYSTPTYFETGSDNDAYLMHYFYPVEDTEWAVVTSALASVVYQFAWQNSWPIFMFGLGIFAIFLISTLTVFSPILKDLRSISSDMEKMTKGSFEISFSDPSSKGEVTQLFDRFQLLAGSLASRLQEQSDLLSLNEQMSSKEKLSESLYIIMDAAVKSGADSVRIILNDSCGLKQSEIVDAQFSLGPSTDLFAHLDEEIKALVRSQGDVIMRDFQITKKFSQKNERAFPSALIAFPMDWQGRETGLFWVAYQSKKSITAEDIHFIRTLSQKASMTIARARTLNKAIGLKNHLESVLDIVKDGILLVNDTNQVIYHNISARSMLGLSAEQMVDRQIHSLVNKPSLADFIMKADKRVEARDFTMDDGTICQVSVSEIDFETDKKVKSVIFQDITKAKKQEMIKSEFVTTASHELRSPLTLIHGYAKLLRLTGNLNEQQDTYINNIIEGVEDMKNLVQNLLDIGRLESGHILEKNSVSATALAKNVFESMQPFAKQKNIHLDLLLPDSPVEFDADEVFLAQALKNLIENAIKFTKMGGDVTLAVREMEDSIIFAVQDNGIGIAPLDQRHLFEKFKHRGAPLGKESKGSGLGLAIVKSIAERHGGRVWFESQLARGSTFFIEIPQRLDKNQ